jgi:hypothetical protein
MRCRAARLLHLLSATLRLQVGPDPPPRAHPDRSRPRPDVAASRTQVHMHIRGHTAYVMFTHTAQGDRYRCEHR